MLTRDQRRHRPDALAVVRPRSMREQGQQRLTPGYLTDLSDTKVATKSIPTNIVTFRAKAAANADATTSITITKPTGTTTDDILIALIVNDATRVLTPPSQWTELFRATNVDHQAALYWKKAGASEASNYTWSWTGDTDAKGIILAYYNVDPTTPLDTQAAQNNAGTSHDAPTITTTYADAHLVALYSAFNGTTFTWTPPTSFTEREDDWNDRLSIEVADLIQNTPGPSGAKTATPALSSNGRGHLVALNPRLTTTLLTPTTGKRTRLIQINVIQETSDGSHLMELFYGTGPTINTTPAKAIDILRIPDAGEKATRSWTRGAGPRGAKNEVLTAHFQRATSGNHQAVIEYTEERATNGP